MLDYIQNYADWGWNGILDFVLPFLIVLSVLVFVHEWGHYIVARWCGIRVEVFSIGFGKELFGFTDKSGTRWKFSLIPLGGYVQMFGDEDPASAQKSDQVKDGEIKRPMTEEERKVAFFSKAVWQRSAVVFAGPAINFIFAILLLIGIYASVGKPVTPPIAAGVVIGGAADQAGIQPHDRIVSIDGRSMNSFSEVQRQVSVSLNRPLDVVLQRGDQTLNMTLTPIITEMTDRFGFSHSRGVIGLISSRMAISFDEIQAVNGKTISDSYDFSKIMNTPSIITLPWGDEKTRDLRINPFGDNNQANNDTLILGETVGQDIVTFSFTESVSEALKETWFMVSGTFEALSQIFTGTRSPEELGGIIRIGAIAGDAAAAGIVALISFTAMLSINLGLINLFPIPLLDGGHLVFYAYEAIFKKPMPEKVMDYALRFGMVFLIGLMAFANLNDIIQMIL